MEWADILTSISKQISRPSFETWLSNTTADIKEDAVIVKAKNDFQAEWIEARYKPLIEKTLEKVTGKCMEVEIVIKNEKTGIEQQLFQKHFEDKTFEELKSLILAQQEKINELEERICRLEYVEKNKEG